jgi:TP901 family phage tail tape measure protein
MDDDKMLILIQAQIDQSQNAISKLQKQVDAIGEELKFNIGVNIDSSKIQQVNEQINNVGNTAAQVGQRIDNSITKNDTYKLFAERIQYIQRKIEESGGHIVDIQTKQNAKTGEITSATVKYATSLGQVRTELYKIQKQYEEVNGKNVLTGVSLNPTAIKSANNVLQQQNKNYKEAMSLLQGIHGLEKQKLALTDYDKNLNQVINKQIETRRSKLLDILSDQIQIGENERESALTGQQRLQISQQYKQNQEEILRLQAASKDVLSNTTQWGTRVDKPIDYNADIQQLQSYIKALYGAEAEIGRIDSEKIDKFGNRIRQVHVEMQTGEDRIQKYTTTLVQSANQAETNIYSANAGMTQSFNRSLSTMEQLKQAFEKFPIWMIASTVFYQTVAFFREGIRYVNELNQSLTEISMVTGKTQEQVVQLGQAYADTAKNMGILTKDMVAGAVEFYRQGNSDAEVMEKLTTNVRFAKIANMDFKQSAEALTATVNGMNVDIERASDVMLTIGDATATSAAELARANQQVSGTAGALGIEYEKLISYIAVISAKTRESASSIGNSLKTIFARMSALTEKGFWEEDGTKINDVAKALASINVELTKSDGTFRNFADVLDDVGKKFNTLNNKQKAYIASTLGGVRQQSRLYSLFENYSESLDLYDKALDASGATQSKFNLYLESTEAHLNRLKDSATGVWQDLFDDNAIRNGIDFLNGIVSGLGFVIDKLGLLPTILTAVATTILATKKNISLTNLEMDKTADASISLIGYLRQLFTNALYTDTAFKSLGASIKTVGKTILSTLANVGVVFGISLVIGKITEAITNLVTKAQQAREELQAAAQQSKENISTLNEQIDGLKKLTTEYEQLKEKKSLTAEEAERLYEIQRQLVEQYGVTATGIDSQGRAYSDNIQLIRQRIDALEEEREAEEKLLQSRMTSQHDADVKNLNKSLKQQTEILDEIGRKQEEFDKIESIIALPEDQRNQQTTMSLQALEGMRSSLRKQISDLQQDLADAGIEIQGQLKQYQQMFDTYANDMIKDISDRGVDVSDAGRAFITQFANSLVYQEGTLDEKLQQLKSFINEVLSSGLLQLMADYASAIEAYVNNPTDDASQHIDALAQQINNVSSGIVDKFIPATDNANLGIRESNESMKRWTEQNYVASNSLDDITDASNNLADAQRQAAEDTEERAKAEKKLIDAYNDQTTKVQKLYKALDELNSKEGVSGDTLQYLISNYPELLQHLDDEAGLREALQGKIKEEEEVQRQSYINRLEYSETFYNSLLDGNTKLYNKLSEFYGQDAKNFHNIAEAKLEIDNKLRQVIGTKWAELYGGLAGAHKKVGALKVQQRVYGYDNPEADRYFQGQINQIQSVFNLYADLEKEARQIADHAGGSIGLKINTQRIKTPKASKGKSSKSSKSKSQKEEYTIELDRYRELNKEISILNDLLQRNQALYDKSDSNKRNQLLKERINLYNKLINAERNLQHEQRRERTTVVDRLKRYGFKFDSIGKISNYSNQIKRFSGDTAKEVENLIKRFDELDTAIVSSDTKILDYTNQIKDATLTLASSMTSNVINRFTNELQKLDNQLKLLGDNDINAKLLTLQDKTRLTDEYIKQLNNTLHELNTNGMYNSVRGTEDFQNKLKELNDAVVNAKISLNDLNRQQNELIKNVFSSYYNSLFKNIDEEIAKIEETKQAIRDKNNVEIEALEAQIKLLEDKNEELNEEEERYRRLRDIQQQAERLENIKKQRTVWAINNQGEKIYIADPQKVKDESDKLQKLQEDYAKWERDTQYNKQIQALRDRINYLKKQEQTEIESYDNRIKELRNFLTEQKEYIDSYGEMQVNTITDIYNALIGIDKDKYSERLDLLNSFVQAWNALVSRMKFPNQTGSNLSIDTSTTSISVGKSKYNTDMGATVTYSSSAKAPPTGAWSSEDEAAYLRANPDVARAVRDNPKEYPSGYAHWLRSGKREGRLAQYKTGGYTGEWGDWGKMAILHEKELVLNKEQTADLLKTIKINDTLIKQTKIPVHYLNTPRNTRPNYTNQSHSEKYDIHIDKVVTDDARSFIDELPTLVHQYKG